MKTHEIKLEDRFDVRFNVWFDVGFNVGFDIKRNEMKNRRVVFRDNTFVKPPRETFVKGAGTHNLGAGVATQARNPQRPLVRVHRDW